MRARSVFAVCGCLAFSLVAPFACFNASNNDFADFQGRVAGFDSGLVIEAATFEAAPPPTQAVQGTYYGACLSELAFRQVKKVFNLLTVTSFVPGGTGGSLTLSNHTLKLENAGPPANVSVAGEVGDEIKQSLPATVDANGAYSADLGTVTFPGSANPISGSDVVISNTKLQGRFSAAKFCARLGGHVDEPAAAARTLDPAQNICQFLPIKDGDPTPTFTLADFQPESCPVP
jgi:hypothetical protein